jgi:hypothetical protein
MEIRECVSRVNKFERDARRALGTSPEQGIGGVDQLPIGGGRSASLLEMKEPLSFTCQQLALIRSYLNKVCFEPSKRHTYDFGLHSKL